MNNSYHLTKGFSALTLVLICLFSLGFFACQKQGSCTSDQDCPQGQVCSFTQVCVFGQHADATSLDQTGLADIPALPCDPPLSGELIINEVLADPGGADTNQDGTASSTQDEFVELVNISTREINLSGVELLVKGQRKHYFMPECLAAGRGLVLFSGGTVLETEIFQGARVMLSQSSLSLTNSGASVDLLHNGAMLDNMSYGPEGGKDESVSRSPEFTGAWMKHSEIPAAQGGIMSPGYCADGQAFPNCSSGTVLTDSGSDSGTVIIPPTDTSVLDCSQPFSGTLAINEILYDPPTGTDPNGDGNASASQDEFVEIVVLGGEPINLDGVRVLISGEVKHTFEPFCLSPGTVAVVFGGGTPNMAMFPGSKIIKSNKSLGLNNSGESIEIQDKDNFFLDSYAYSDGESPDQSLTRFPDGTGVFTPHLSVEDGSRAYSPGTCANGAEYPGCESL
jgi:hypothetical protein